MMIDLLIMIVLLVCLIQGYRKGLAITVLHLCGWLAAIAASYLCLPYVKSWVGDNTHLDDYIRGSIIDIMDVSSIVPGMDSSNDIGTGIASIAVAAAANYISGLILGAVCFVLLVIAIKLVCFILELLLKRRLKSGAIGTVNRIAGAAAGIIKGAVWAAVILAAVLIFAGIAMPDMLSSLLYSAQNSVILRLFIDPETLLDIASTASISLPN